MQKGVSHKNMACVFFCLERKWGASEELSCKRAPKPIKRSPKKSAKTEN